MVNLNLKASQSFLKFVEDKQSQWRGSVLAQDPKEDLLFARSRIQV